jgi:rare lipoprotein A
MERGRGLWLAALVVLTLAGCATPPRRPVPSVPPPSPVPLPSQPPTDVAAVPDAVPRREPRSSLGNPPFYSVAGRRYALLASADGYVERGVASWYGPDFHGGRTATGELYDMYGMTAAHKTLPIPCYARVTNLSNGRSVIVRINDRGPFVADRLIDLSYTAAAKLDMIRHGTAFVQVETLSELQPADAAPTLMPPPPTAQPASAPAANPAPPAITPPAAPTQFFIQVGAYGQADNARRVIQRLRDAGLPVLALGPEPGKPLQRVRLGPLASVEEFDALMARLTTLGFAGARLAQD